MFIEKLWAKNPDKVRAVAKKICRINESNGDTFGFRAMDDKGNLEFVKFGDVSFVARFSDFDVELAFNNSFAKMPALSLEWMQFMKEVFGDKYLYHYIAHRNKEIDDYNKKFSQQTNKVLKALGFDVTKDVIKK